VHDEFSNERFGFLEGRVGLVLKKLKRDYLKLTSNTRSKILTIVTMLAAIRKSDARDPDSHILRMTLNDE
jgi:hypothetical protein